MSEIFNHDEFVENYQLTVDEYSLLPKNLRLTYADKLYRPLVESAEQKKYSAIGYMHPAFNEYFHACGCRFEYYELVNQYSIEKVWDVDFTPTNEDRELVGDYVRAIAEARWQIYANCVKEAYQEQIKAVDEGRINEKFCIFEAHLPAVLGGNVYTRCLNAEKSEELIKRELDSYIKDQESIDIGSFLHEGYLQELQSRGFSKEANNSNVITRKLK